MILDGFEMLFQLPPSPIRTHSLPIQTHSSSILDDLNPFRCRLWQFRCWSRSFKSPITMLQLAVSDTSGHRLLATLQLTGDTSVRNASSFAPFGDASVCDTSTQLATLRLPPNRRPFASQTCNGYFFFSFLVKFFVNFCLMILNAWC